MALLGLVLTAQAVTAAEEEGGKAKPAVPAGPVFVKMPPINVPVINGNRVAAQVGISVSLELVDGKTAADLEPKQRLLQDAFIRDLYVIFQQRTDPAHPVDGGLIKSRLMMTAERVLGPGLVKDVLIGHLFEQPMR